MNIAKALKIKNRLVGQITKKQEIIKRENSRRNDSLSTVDVSVEISEWNKLREELIDLKTKISTASVPILNKIIELAELKTTVIFYRCLNTREGTEKIAYGQTNVVDYVWVAEVNTQAQDAKISELETKISELQDDIDNFNAVTSI
jgi:hypothetical protein